VGSDPADDIYSSAMLGFSVEFGIRAASAVLGKRPRARTQRDRTATCRTKCRDARAYRGCRRQSRYDGPPFGSRVATESQRAHKR